MKMVGYLPMHRVLCLGGNQNLYSTMWLAVANRFGHEKNLFDGEVAPDSYSWPCDLLPVETGLWNRSRKMM